MKVLGRVIESLSPRIVKVIAPAPMPLGEYLALDYQINDIKAKAIAVVANAQSRHAVEPSAIKYMEPEKFPDMPSITLSEMELYVVAEKIGNGKLAAPRYPVPPDTPVRRVTPAELEELYGMGRGVKLGTLEIGGESSIEIKIDPNKLTKHLFIAGATGSGKSNTVAVLIDRLSKMGAPVVVFDVHGEYNMQLKEGGMLKVIDAVINPLLLPPRVLAGLIIPDAKATRQRRLLVKAIRAFHKKLEDLRQDHTLEEALKTLVGGEEPEEADLPQLYARSLLFKVRQIGMEDKSYGSKITGTTEDKVEEFFEVAPVSLTAPDMLSEKARGIVLVVDASRLSDEQKRWILKFIADELLLRLKQSQGRDSVILVVEEAPLFLGDKLSHPVKDSLQRFAREGRKFGGCLVIVSQRPRSLDVNVVSQLQNFIFLKVVQEEDVRTIMNIADNLEENLATMIKSFPEGRALVLGEFVGRFPALVKIDRHEGKKLGVTPNLLELWEEKSRTEKTYYGD